MTPILLNSKRPWNARAIQEHVRLLVLHCLPRLIAGTELYDLDRKTASNAGVLRGLVLWVAGDRSSTGISRAKEWLAILMLVGLVVMVARLARESARSVAAGPEGDQWRRARIGTLDRGRLPGEPEYLQLR